MQNVLILLTFNKVIQYFRMFLFCMFTYKCFTDVRFNDLIVREKFNYGDGSIIKKKYFSLPACVSFYFPLIVVLVKIYQFLKKKVAYLLCLFLYL